MGILKGRTYYTAPGETPPRLKTLIRQTGIRSMRILGPAHASSPYHIPGPPDADDGGGPAARARIEPVELRARERLAELKLGSKPSREEIERVIAQASQSGGIAAWSIDRGAEVISKDEAAERSRADIAPDANISDFTREGVERAIVRAKQQDKVVAWTPERGAEVVTKQEAIDRFPVQDVTEPTPREKALPPQSKFIKDGSIDVLKAVRAGFDRPADFKGFNITQAQINEAKKQAVNVIELKDGKLVDREEWNKLDPKHQSIGLNKGFTAMMAAIDKDVNIQKQAAKSLKPYESKEGVDIAKYLRDNPGKTDTLLEAGFNRAAVKEAGKVNLEFLGIGAPGHIDRNVFINDYFKGKGWDRRIHRGLANEKQVREFNKRLNEANKKYQAEYAPPMSHEQYIRNYFQDKDWEYKLNRSQVDTSAVRQYDNRVREATESYMGKFGGETVAKQGLGKLADTFVPGVYLAKNWNEISATEKAIIIAIDVAFVGIIFAKPIGAAARIAGRIPKPSFVTHSKYLGKVIKDTYGQYDRVVTKLADNVDRAIRTGNANKIAKEATKMHNHAQVMKSNNIPGADRIIDNSKVLIERANYIARLKDSRMPKILKKALNDLGKEVQRLEAVEVRAGPGAQELRQPITARTAAGRVTTVPLTRAEAQGFGLSADDINRIFSKVGENRQAFWNEAKAFRQQKLQTFFDDINKQLAEQGLPDKPVTIKKPAVPVKPKPAAPKTPQQKEVSEWISERFAKQTNPEREEYLRELERQIAREREKNLAKWRTDRVHRETGELVAKARANEFAIKAAAAKAIKQLSDMSIARAATIINQQNLTNAIASVSPAFLAEILAKVSTKTRTELESKLSLAVLRALKQKQLAKAKSQAATELKQATKTAVKTAPKPVTKPVVYTATKIVTEPLVETKLVPKPAPKPVPKPVKTGVKPPTKPPAKPPAKPPIKPPTKPPIKPPTKPPKKPPLRPPIRFRSGDPEKKKRETIKKSPGAVAWYSGKLHKKTIIDVIIHPWRGKDSHTTLVGKLPPGFRLVTGKGSAAKSVVLLRGTAPPKKVLVDKGIIDAHVNPAGRGVKLTFTADPKQETIGDITVGLSRSTPRITRRPPRITPKRPRLRR